LTSDGPGQAQWSHLVEHLVVRSTTQDLEHFNAETLGDHMRLDYYGTVANWQEGLEHHRRWLTGVPFTEKSLKAEKPNVNQEVAYVEGNGFTHKFALAAWAQAYRHGRKHAAIRGDVVNASLAAIQRYRDERLVVLDRTVVCAVGGVSADAALPVMARQLEEVRSEARPAQPVETSPGNRDVTWDLGARHLLITWPIPDADKEDYASLMVLGQLLTMRLFGDSALKSMSEGAMAGADLRTPEGAYFYISASLKQGAPAADVRQRLWNHVDELQKHTRSLGQARSIGGELALSLTRVPDPAPIQRQSPPGTTLAMIEGQLGLERGMFEFQYGPRLTGLAQRLSAIDATKVQQAALRYLKADQSSTYTIGPASGQDQKCSVEVQTPRNGETVSRTVRVEGVATVPPETFLWILTHPKGSPLWWPKGNRAAVVTEGRWGVRATLGQRPDAAQPVEIAAAVVDADRNDDLIGWVRKTQETGLYPGIEFPVTVPACQVQRVSVMPTPERIPLQQTQDF
jgi:predicted Zn-dependent peptidase